MKEEEVSMLRVSNIKLNIDDNKSKIKSSLLKKLKIKENQPYTVRLCIILI